MGASLNMSMVLCSSMADPLTPVHPVIIPIQRSGELKVLGLTNVGMCIHQNVFAFLHLLSFIPPL